MSGDFWGSQEGCQGPSRPSGSVTQSCLTLQPHGLQHARLPCPSPTPGVYSHSCPLSWRCHPTISSSVICFSACPQSFPASGSFQMSHFKFYHFNPYMTTGKTIALTRQTFVGKVMSLLFNMLSRLVAFTSFWPCYKRNQKKGCPF